MSLLQYGPNPIVEGLLRRVLHPMVKAAEVATLKEGFGLEVGVAVCFNS